MALQIYNSLSKRKETFEPLAPPKVNMYVCGVTVYDYSHIGHARCYLAFDVIYRYLRFLGYDVTYVRNFTDVDDKIIKRANERNLSCIELSDTYIAEYHRDMTALKILQADIEPRVTGHIDEIITLIQRILDNGHAYVVDGDVQFSIDSFAEYGELSRRDLTQMRAGGSERVDVDTRLRNPFDFALWKSSKPGEPTWDSPWGPGRPGWHIECSAMSMTHLGETFDLHGGGKDLVFPHHENEIAQSRCASHKPFAKTWMHNGFVNVDNEKMSKSLGNFFTIRNVLELFHPDVLRYFLMTTHYRKPINYSDVGLRAATKRVDSVYELLQKVETRLGGAPEPDLESPVVAEFREAMDDDFNAAKAIGNLAPVLDELALLLDGSDNDSLNRMRELRAGLQPIFDTLAIFNEEPAGYLAQSEEYTQRRASQRLEVLELTPEAIETLIVERTTARKERNWGRADAIRDELAEKGIELMDSPQGTTWRVLAGERGD